MSRMKGNFQVRFLGEGVAAMLLPYPTLFIDPEYFAITCRKIEAAVAQTAYKAI